MGHHISGHCLDRGRFRFGGIAATSAGIAKIIFFVFIVLFLISLVARTLRGRSPPL